MSLVEFAPINFFEQIRNQRKILYKGISSDQFLYYFRANAITPGYSGRFGSAWLTSSWKRALESSSTCVLIIDGTEAIKNKKLKHRFMSFGMLAFYDYYGNISIPLKNLLHIIITQDNLGLIQECFQESMNSDITWEDIDKKIVLTTYSNFNTTVKSQAHNINKLVQ